MPAARISFNRRVISKNSRILLYEIAYILLKAHDNLLSDIDVEVDLDRLVRRAHLNASGEKPRHGRGKQPSHRSEEHTSELQSLMRISYAVFCLKTKNKQPINYIGSTR